MPDIHEAPAKAAINLRGAGNAFAAAVRAETGLALPDRPNTFTESGGRMLVWLGPDEHMLLDPQADGSALEVELIDALGSSAASVCDVSGNRCSIVVSGDGAIDLLAAGCPIDFATLPENGCAQTLVARAQVVLLKRSAARFELLPRRSFGDYLLAWLRAADTDR
jgi:sarcosine oxidase, subunit gamma